MGQTTPLKPQSLLVEFGYLGDEAAFIKSDPDCRCGSKSFREVHRISQPKGRASIMYQCEKCGEYSL